MDIFINRKFQYFFYRSRPDLYQRLDSIKEEENEVGQIENEVQDICKLPNFRVVIQFEKCVARWKIQNNYELHSIPRSKFKSQL